jgi:CheY-like chemotaxis protein
MRHTVLMIEADPAGIELARSAAAACDVNFSLVLLDDADAVLTWLNDSVIRDRPMPRVILMDLKLPKLDGLATLRKLRKHAATSDIPVLAFSAEFTQADVLMSYQVGVNSFVAKPADLQHFIKFFNEQIPYWLQPRQRKLDLVAK